MRSLVIAISLSAAVVATAAHDIGGAWAVTIPADEQKRPDGSNASWKELKGSLTLIQKDGGLTGTWTSLDEWKLTGRIDDTGRFALESEARDIPVTRNGSRGTEAARWVFRGTHVHGTLSGTAALVIADRDPLFHKWTASRK